MKFKAPLTALIKEKKWVNPTRDASEIKKSFIYQLKKISAFVFHYY